jgi:hypothetical protein
MPKLTCVESNSCAADLFLGRINTRHFSALAGVRQSRRPLEAAVIFSPFFIKNWSYLAQTLDRYDMKVLKESSRKQSITSTVCHRIRSYLDPLSFYKI